MAIFQRNRVYSLIVGTDEEAVEITNLQIEFEVTKTDNNKEKKNQAKVSIYNLSRERQALLEDDYVVVQLRVGYADTIKGGDDIPLLFSGQVVGVESKEGGEALTQRRNTDIITTLTVDEMWAQLNGRVLSTTVPAGKTRKDAIKQIVADIPEVSKSEILGEQAEKEVVDGMPLSGTPRQCLDQLCKSSGMKWQIDNGVLYVADRDGAYTETTEGVPKIGQFSGVIERPQYKSEDSKRVRLKKRHRSESDQGKPDQNRVPTLHCKILLNPTLVAGSVVYLDWEDISGYYQVTEVVHKGSYRGSEWYSELILSAYGQ